MLVVTWKEGTVSNSSQCTKRWVLTVWCVLWFRDLNDIEKSGRLFEDRVHLLETSVSCLWVEEIDRRYDECVDDREDDVCLIANSRECNRGDHDHHEVENPVCGSGQGTRRRTDTQRHNLRRIEPGHAKPSNGEEAVEDEEEHNRNVAGDGFDGLRLSNGE